MEINTIKDLKRWMSENCYNSSYTVGEMNHDGFSLTLWDKLYVWSYSERGTTEKLNYFRTEKEAVDFVFGTLRNDKFARTHFVGYLSDTAKENEVTNEFSKRGIEIFKDTIPTLNGNKTRFLVVGCGIDKIEDLSTYFVSN